MQVLVSWLGTADLDLMSEDKKGPLATIALMHPQPFDELVILANRGEEYWDRYERWLKKQLAIANRPDKAVKIRKASISSPIDYQTIYKVIKPLLVDELAIKFDKVVISLTSGTPAMSTISVLVGKGLSQCEFVQSSKEQGIQPVEIPIDFKSSYQAVTDERLATVAEESPRIESAFDSIVAKSPAMQVCLGKAKKLAQTDLPGLILGETGTGKERMAQSIHRASQRADKPLQTINCGAIAENLIDSILFGHKKGAFTGAIGDAKGLFEQAEGGTVFLDEVGELSLAAQVKLLRVLQQKELTPVGAENAVTVDVRILAATHRDLSQMVLDGEFREDLYYRLAVGVIEIPSLRERQQDIEQLIHELMLEINAVAGKHLQFDSKKISNKVINFAKEQAWPGNVRELWNTLSRAILWSDNQQLTVQDLDNAMHKRQTVEILERPQLNLGKSVDLNQILDNINKNYISQALEITGNNKSKASKMLGLANHQTLLNRMKKLGIE